MDGQKIPILPGRSITPTGRGKRCDRHALPALMAVIFHSASSMAITEYGKVDKEAHLRFASITIENN